MNSRIDNAQTNANLRFEKEKVDRELGGSNQEFDHESKEIMCFEARSTTTTENEEHERNIERHVVEQPVLTRRDIVGVVFHRQYPGRSALEDGDTVGLSGNMGHKLEGAGA